MNVFILIAAWADSSLELAPRKKKKILSVMNETKRLAAFPGVVDIY